MAGTGGKREGAGRPTKANELGTADLTRKALVERYGGLNEALIALLETQEPSLLKFVYEHAFGKPTDKIEHSGEIENKQPSFSETQFAILINKINANSTG